MASALSAPGHSNIPDQQSALTCPRRELLSFGIVTIALSWIPWLCLGFAHADIGAGIGFVIFGLAAAGPSLAALVMRIARRRRSPGARAHPSLSWPIAALIFGAAPAIVAAVCTNWTDLGSIPAHAAATIASVGGPLGALAYTLVSGPLSEEFGWRGFLQPRLRSRVGRVQAAMLLGTFWGLWHVPLFFLVGTEQQAMGITSVQGILFFVGLFPLSFTFLFLSERLRGGVWAAVIAHAAWNLSEALMPGAGSVVAVIETVTMFAIAIIVGVIWQRTRTKETVTTRMRGNPVRPEA